jgi:hypothetical protein
MAWVLDIEGVFVSEFLPKGERKVAVETQLTNAAQRPPGEQMKTVKQVGYKGNYGIFDGDKATGQYGSEDEMNALLRGDKPEPKRKHDAYLVWSIFAAGIGALVFLGFVLVMGK